MAQITTEIAGYSYPVGSCRSCRAPIVWAISEASDKPIPLDAVAVDNGNIVFVEQRQRDYEVTPVVRYLRKGEAPVGHRFVTHFATCPNARAHRRKP